MFRYNFADSDDTVYQPNHLKLIISSAKIFVLHTALQEFFILLFSVKSLCLFCSEAPPYSNMIFVPEKLMH